MKDWSISAKLSRSLSVANRLSATLALLLAIGLAAATFSLLPHTDALAGTSLLSALLLLAVIDWRTYRLPDAITLPLLALGLVLSACGLGPSWIASLWGALVGYASFALIAFAYRRLRGRDGLGLGDAKLLAALGAWTGVETLPIIILCAALLGLAAYGVMYACTRQAHASDRIPFGPFLAISGYCAFLGTRLSPSATEMFHAFIELSYSL